MANNPIKYGLRENLLTADPDDCMGRNLRLLTEFAIRQTRADCPNSAQNRLVQNLIPHIHPTFSNTSSCRLVWHSARTVR